MRGGLLWLLGIPIPVIILLTSFTSSNVKEPLAARSECTFA